MEAPVHGHDYQRHSGAVYHSLRSKNPWTTGYLRRLPTSGLLALVGAILGIGACAGILIASDGQPIAYWKFQPTVYLAIFSTLTNIFLTFALSEGAEIAWWRKASSAKTTVADLHRTWSHGKSFWQALTAGRNMTLVAAACLLATIAQINSPLLQRASTVSVTGFPSNVKLSLRAAQEIPYGYTGFTSGRGLNPSLFTSRYLKTVQEWNSNFSIPIEKTACAGSCATKLTALGLHVNCSTFKVPFDIKPQTFANGTFDVASSVVGANVFQTTFYYDIRNGPNMTFQVTYKNTSNCEGDLTIEKCTIQAATMEFPVIIDGNKSTIALDSRSDIYSDRVVSIYNTMPRESLAGPSTLGGYQLALQNKFFSNASIRFTGAVGPYTVLTEGNTALQYAIVNETGSAWSSCNTSFRSPTSDILKAARELMFRTSIAAANSSTPLQNVDAVDTGIRAVWKSNYYYMAGAIAITLIASFVVLAIFKGYAHLGRNPTMSPIEIAKAFNAPLLQSHDDNAEADDLIRDVGARSVRYGAVQEGNQTSGQYMGHGVPTEYKPYNPHVQEVHPRRRLVMGDETQVRKPESGEVFTGN